jgi:anti-sigma B factor antagonist
MITTSAGATARQVGRRPEAGLAAARTIVRLGDSLDFAAAPALRDRLIGPLYPGTRLLVLDLSRVPSCDPAGLAVLIGIQRRARQIGIAMRLAAPASRSRRCCASPAWTAASPSVPICAARSPGNGTNPRRRTRPRQSWLRCLAKARRKSLA